MTSSDLKKHNFAFSNSVKRNTLTDIRVSILF